MAPAVEPAWEPNSRRSPASEPRGKKTRRDRRLIIAQFGEMRTDHDPGHEGGPRLERLERNMNNRIAASQASVKSEIANIAR